MQKAQTDQWLKDVMRAYEPRLLRYLGRMVPPQVAREITQEAFLKIMSEDPNLIQSYTAEWLFTVCRNSARDFLRKERFTDANPMAALAMVDPTPLPSHSLETQQQLELVQKFIARLPAREQEVLRLKFQEGFSYKEISRITGHSISYVGVLIHQSIHKIRAALAKGATDETGT